MGTQSFSEQETEIKVGILGGPVADNPPNDFAQPGYLQALLIGQAGVGNPLFYNNNIEQKEVYSYGSLWGGAALSNSLNGNLPVIYIVKKGDTLSKIALDFGVSVQTIIGANPAVKTHSLQIGQELIILPISGRIYYAKAGETPESIAASFQLTAAQLYRFNNSANFNSFETGKPLVIPGATPYLSESDSRSFMEAKNYFIKPAEGFNWGKLHPQNAVDIANSCGTPIKAAAEGLVTDISTDDWSFGYGNYLIIEHPNGAKTRYAHLKSVSVSLGDYLQQGELIGTMGDTGEATGCHLHFEVEGAANPFAR